MLISLIIPTHNRADALAQTLERLKRQKLKYDWEAIVINNNCTDDTDAVVKKWPQNFPVPLHLVYEKKPGAAAARNAGVRRATGEYLVFIDNDILTEPNFLQQHFEALEQNPKSWIVGQIVNLPAQEESLFGKFRKSLFPVDSASDDYREVNTMAGANSSMPRADFEKLGGFDENFEIASSEDQELAMRARRLLGVKVLLAPQILVVHNDWAGWTFRDFCVRQNKYANTEFFFWKKYGKDHPRLRLVEENLPIDWQSDSARLKFRKLVKRGLGNRAAQAVLINASLLAERVLPYKFVLWRLYKLSLTGAIHRGFEKGRRDFLAKTEAETKRAR